MRFLKENIADWVIEYLKDVGPTNDAELHWTACNTFMTRDEITSGTNALGKFSYQYELAMGALKNKNYVFHNEEDDVITYKELDKLNPRELIFDKNIKNKIKCLYIVEFENGCKIGMTVDMRNRISNYNSPWCREILSIQVIEHENPSDIEEHLKKAFECKRVGRSTEFFAIKKEEIHKEIAAAFSDVTIVDYAR